MININQSNMIGATSSVQGESISTDTSSTWMDFINQFELGFENNGDISNKTEDVEEELILYNLICNIYQKFNIEDDIGNSEKLESIKNILDSKLNVNLDVNNNFTLESSNTLLDLKDSTLELNNTLLDSNDFKEVIDYINNYIDEYKNVSDKEELNKQFNLLVDKIKERLEVYDKSNNDVSNYNVSNYENLDSIGAFNKSKIDEYSSFKNKDIDCLENILSSNDNNYSNSIGGFNKFNTVYNNNIKTDTEQPVSEIRQEFISDDIVKAVKYIKSNDMESLNVKFNPRDLGEISINISKHNEESNLLITVDSDSVFDFVNENIQDIKNHLKDTNIDIKDVFIVVKSDNENLFSDNLSRGFNQESNFKQNKNNKSKKDNQEIIDDLTINDYNNDDENLNILI
nr:flagellar hook-length control protein FliK [uncultured Romboutsia sp.]